MREADFQPTCSYVMKAAVVKAAAAHAIKAVPRSATECTRHPLLLLPQPFGPTRRVIAAPAGM